MLNLNGQTRNVRLPKRRSVALDQIKSGACDWTVIQRVINLVSYRPAMPIKMLLIGEIEQLNRLVLSPSRAHLGQVSEQLNDLVESSGKSEARLAPSTKIGNSVHGAHLASAALRPISRRCSAVSDSARAFAPACPLRTRPDGSLSVSLTSPTDNRATITAAPITSAGRFSPLGPVGISSSVAPARRSGLYALIKVVLFW